MVCIAQTLAPRALPQIRYCTFFRGDPIVSTEEHRNTRLALEFTPPTAVFINSFSTLLTPFFPSCVVKNLRFFLFSRYHLGRVKVALQTGCSSRHLFVVPKRKARILEGPKILLSHQQTHKR